ncbi:MAG: alpha/beta fold hydrolase, partial [Trueperella pyogenes]|nr:alpha/beta fold hydrolase [Trueperella pyogenes]
MQIHGVVPQAPFVGELPQEVTCVGIPTSAGVLTAAFIDEAVAGIVPKAESALEVHEVPHAGQQPEPVPALLVPGFTGSKEDFTPFLPYLAERGRSACAYSQRGQADSAAPKGVENYRLADFVGDLIEIARAMGASERPIHLLGHSFGGVIARQAAVVAPELFRSVTLFSTGPRPPEG